MARALPARAPASADAEENAPARRTRMRRCRLTVGRLEERIAVLERIATDPAERTAREIEQLALEERKAIAMDPSKLDS